MSEEIAAVLNIIGWSAALYFYIHSRLLKEKLGEALKQSGVQRRMRSHLMRSHDR